jgi:hypothetical protein
VRSSICSWAYQFVRRRLDRQKIRILSRIRDGRHSSQWFRCCRALRFPVEARSVNARRTILRGKLVKLRGSVIGLLSAFVDLFAGISSFAAGSIAKKYGYSAAFVMAAIALSGSAVAGHYVFRSKREVLTPDEQYCEANS